MVIIREIKFRGKRIDNNEWIYGYLLYDYDMADDYVPFIIWKDERYLGGSGEEQVIEHTIGQYTGLKDKNEKEIYEGDIVKVHFDKKDAYTINTLNFKKSINKIGKIEYIVDGFCVFIEKFGENIYPLSFFGDEIINQLEVIGNIYDNPELLEV